MSKSATNVCEHHDNELSYLPVTAKVYYWGSECPMCAALGRIAYLEKLLAEKGGVRWHWP